MKSAASTLLALLLAVLTLAGAPTASAHAVRLATDPPADAVMATGPAKVSATFNETLQTTFAAMTVVGPDGNLWSTGVPRVHGAIIDIDVLPLGPVGTYTANYRVTSADGHVVTGAWPFHLTVAGTGRPGPSVASASGSPQGVPAWPFLLAAAAVVGGAVWWVIRRRTKPHRR
jgi:methionine-rich copper-binding protein CopC